MGQDHARGKALAKDSGRLESAPLHFGSAALTLAIMQGKKVVIGLFVFGSVVASGLYLARPASWSDELRLAQDGSIVTITIATPIADDLRSETPAVADGAENAIPQEHVAIDVIYRFIDEVDIDSTEGFTTVRRFVFSRKPTGDTKPSFDKKNTTQERIRIPEGSAGKLFEARMVYKTKSVLQAKDELILARKSLVLK